MQATDKLCGKLGGREPAAATGVEMPAQTSLAITKPLIAVVDDDKSVLRSLSRLLRSAGYAVQSFGSAQEFLVSVATLSPQCLVLDVQMPGMSGFELHGRLKDLGHQIPVVYITAHDTPHTGTSACQPGTVGLLFKPFDETELLAIVSKTVAP